MSSLLPVAGEGLVCVTVTLVSVLDGPDRWGEGFANVWCATVGVALGVVMSSDWPV